MARRLFDGTVGVAYGQFYVMSNFVGPDFDAAFAGQVNGICGAATRGTLVLLTGLHTGRVSVVVERHDAAPQLGDQWEDIVEVSFVPDSRRVVLSEWGGGRSWPLNLDQESWRVRYCVTGMDERRQTSDLSGHMPERCLLQAWPASAAPDQVLKRTSAEAAYWHEQAQSRPSVTPTSDAVQPSRTDRQNGERHDRATSEVAENAEAFGPTSRSSSEQSIYTEGSALALSELDTHIVGQLVATDSATRRTIARWAARRASAVAAIDTVSWVGEALEALDRDSPLPEPFDVPMNAKRRLTEDPRIPSTRSTPARGLPVVPQQQVAVIAILNAAGSDPLRAAVSALHAMAMVAGADYERILAELRTTFSLT